MAVLSILALFDVWFGGWLCSLHVTSTASPPFLLWGFSEVSHGDTECCSHTVGTGSLCKHYLTGIAKTHCDSNWNLSIAGMVVSGLSYKHLSVQNNLYFKIKKFHGKLIYESWSGGNGSCENWSCEKKLLPPPPVVPLELDCVSIWDSPFLLSSSRIVLSFSVTGYSSGTCDPSTETVLGPVIPPQRHPGSCDPSTETV